MVKYDYDVEKECFKRVDNRGRPLMINITEGKKVESMLNLGYPISQIYRKIDWVNDINETNLRTFVRNLQNGNIDVSGDYPAPRPVFEDLTISGLENRIEKLEEIVKNHEDRFSELKSDCFISAFADESNEEKGIIDEVKSWMRRI